MTTIRELEAHEFAVGFEKKATIARAMGNGKEVQVCTDGRWQDFILPNTLTQHHYSVLRIKPEPPKPKRIWLYNGTVYDRPMFPGVEEYIQVLPQE